jgi:hypothetical protein
MKSVSRFSAGMALAALLAFAPGAFAASAHSRNAAAGILNPAPAAVLIFAADPGNNIRRGDVVNGNDSCYGNQGWGNDNWGWGGGGWGGNGGGGCSSVPEGGSGLAYLALAGLCCAGAIGLKLRRRTLTQAVN